MRRPKTNPGPRPPNPLEMGLCKEGNCQCGNDFCPKGAHCLNEHCYCTYTDPKSEYFPGRPREYYLEVTGMGQFTCGYDLNNSYSDGGIPTLRSNEYGCVSDRRKEPNRCQWRQACDPWNIPRANREQYICEFKEELNVPPNKMGCYYYPKAVGLKCIAPKGCVCKNSTIKKGEYCNIQ